MSASKSLKFSEADQVLIKEYLETVKERTRLAGVLNELQAAADESRAILRGIDTPVSSDELAEAVSEEGIESFDEQLPSLELDGLEGMEITCQMCLDSSENDMQGIEEKMMELHLLEKRLLNAMSRRTRDRVMDIITTSGNEKLRNIVSND